MKIAYLLGSLNRGGTETLLLDIFRNKRNAHFEIVGIYRKTGQLTNEFNQTGIQLINIAPHSFRYFQYFSQLRKYLKKQDINIVHAQQAIDAIYAWVACLFSSRKIVLTFHGFPESKTFTNLIYKIAMTCADSIVFVSKYQKHLYEEKYKIKKIRQSNVIHNGISFDKLNNYPYHSICQELKIPGDTILMGMVGNFVAVRDQITVCRFLNLLKQQGIKFHFLFIGKKNDAEIWHYDNCVNYCQNNNLSDNVSFLGSRTDVPNILNQLDAFIYSTNHDTFGIAVIEAIAAKIPVFVNDWPVMSEITNYGELATLYKTKDENDLFSTFMLFLHNKSIYKDKALLASERVKEYFNIENHINKLEKLYTNLMVKKLC